MVVIAYPNEHYPPDAEALGLADVVIGELSELGGCGRSSPDDRLRPCLALSSS